jgi:ATP-dependent Lon protease
VRKIGTVGIVRQMARAGGGGLNIIIEGVARVRADVVNRTGTSMRAQITPLPENYERTLEVDAHVRRIQELIDKALSLATGLSEELRGVVMNIEDPLRLAYVLAHVDRYQTRGQAGAPRGKRSAEEARGDRDRRSPARCRCSS